MKECKNRSCPMRGIMVKTDKTQCLNCGDKLTEPIASLLNGLFGGKV